MQIGPYSIERELGRGGMGAVYLGRAPGAPNPVAVKVIHADLADDPDLLARFQREGAVLQHLDHPHLVALRARGTFSGGLWLAMDYVEGESLDERLKRTGPFSSPDARRLLRSLCAGISHAHASGVLHRDLKPANVLLRRPDGHPLIADFGLALPLDVSQHLTRTGEVLGSPGYLAPEQCGMGASTSAETDVYGLGAVLYNVLTGQQPLRGASLMGTLDMVLNTPPRPPSELVPDVDPSLEAICLRCLAKDPGERFTDADELERALSSEAPAPRQAGPASLLALGTGIGLLGVLVIYLALETSAPSVPPSVAEVTLTPTPTPTPRAAPPTPSPSTSPRDSSAGLEKSLRERVEAALEDQDWERGHAALDAGQTAEGLWLRYLLLRKELETNDGVSEAWIGRRQGAIDEARHSKAFDSPEAAWAGGLLAMIASLQDPLAGTRYPPPAMEKARADLEDALADRARLSRRRVSALVRSAGLHAVQHFVSERETPERLARVRRALERWRQGGASKWEVDFAHARVENHGRRPGEASHYLDRAEAAVVESGHPWGRYACALLRAELLSGVAPIRRDQAYVARFIYEAEQAPRPIRIRAAILAARYLVDERGRAGEALELLRRFPVQPKLVEWDLYEEHFLVSIRASLESGDARKAWGDLARLQELRRGGEVPPRQLLLAAISLVHLGQAGAAREQLARVPGRLTREDQLLALRAAVLVMNHARARAALDQLERPKSLALLLRALQVLLGCRNAKTSAGTPMVTRRGPLTALITRVQAPLAESPQSLSKELIHTGHWVLALDTTYAFTKGAAGVHAEFGARLSYRALLRGLEDADPPSELWRECHERALANARATLSRSAPHVGLLALLESVGTPEVTRFPALKASLEKAVDAQPVWSELHDGLIRLIERWRRLGDAPTTLEFEGYSRARRWSRLFRPGSLLEGEAALALSGFLPHEEKVPILERLVGSAKQNTALSSEAYRQALLAGLAAGRTAPKECAEGLNRIAFSPLSLQAHRREIFLDSAETFLILPGNALFALATLDRLEALCGEPPPRLQARYFLARARANAELGRFEQAYAAVSRAGEEIEMAGQPKSLRTWIYAARGRIETKLRVPTAGACLRRAKQAGSTQEVWLEVARGTMGSERIEAYRRALRYPFAAGGAEAIHAEINQAGLDPLPLVQDAIRYLEGQGDEADAGLALSRSLFLERDDPKSALLVWEAFLARCGAVPGRFRGAAPDLQAVLTRAGDRLAPALQQLLSAQGALFAAREEARKGGREGVVLEALDRLRSSAQAVPRGLSDRLRVPYAEYAALLDARGLGAEGARRFETEALPLLEAWHRRGIAPLRVTRWIAFCAVEQREFARALGWIQAGLSSPEVSSVSAVRASLELDLASYLSNLDRGAESLDAIARCLETTKIHLERSYALCLRSRILRRAGKLDAARLALEQARVVCPSVAHARGPLPRILLSSVELAIDAGEFSRAAGDLTTLQETIGRRSGHAPVILAGFKVAAARLLGRTPEKRERAEALIDEALEILPRSIEARLARARLMVAHGQRTEASTYAAQEAKDPRLVLRDRRQLERLAAELSKE